MADLRVAAGGCTLIVATGIRYRTVGRKIRERFSTLTVSVWESLSQIVGPKIIN